MESDWKKFRAILPEIREEYLRSVNDEIARSLTSGGESATERFWDAKERIEETSKILHCCMDGLSRSTMKEKIYLLCRYGILKEDCLSDFSEEIQRGWRSLQAVRGTEAHNK